MKIVGYCTLWAIAASLLVAMCVIIKQGHVQSDSGKDSDIVAGKAVGRTPTEPSAPKPVSHASLSSV